MKKYEVKKSNIAGLGLFAIENIQKGEVVCEWNPKILSKAQVSELTKSERLDFVYEDDGDYLLMQPPERYVNHSCQPNTYVMNRSDIAIRDIRTGEEITSDYLSSEIECNCGKVNCRSK